MERTISRVQLPLTNTTDHKRNCSNGMIKEGDKDVMVYYHSKYLFSKLKYRIENDETKIKIREPVKVDLEVINLGEVE